MGPRRTRSASGCGRESGVPARLFLIALSATFLVSLVGVGLIPRTPNAHAVPVAGTNVGVGVGSTSARTPDLAVDAAGGLHSVWSEDRTGTFAIQYASSSDGTTWTAPIRVSDAVLEAFSPRISVNAEPGPYQGRRYVAYQTGVGMGSGQTWYVLSDDGALWSSPLALDAGPNGAVTPDVAATGTRLYAAWPDGRAGSFQIYFRVSFNGGGMWQSEVALTASGDSNSQVRIAAKLDTVVLVWRQQLPNDRLILAGRSEDSGATWAFSLLATVAAPGDVTRPDVHVDEAGTAHVVWNQTNPAGGSRVLYSRSVDGLSWSTPVRVDDGPAGTFAGAPSIDSVAGTLWATWIDTRNGDGDVFASWSLEGRTWGDGLINGNDVRVDDTDSNGTPTDDASAQSLPALATGGYGVYAVWQDRRPGTNDDVYFAEILAPSVVLTEVQDEPVSQIRVEMYNYARAPFDLTGVTLEAGTSSVDLSPIGAIPARGYVVVGAPASSDLQASLGISGEGARIEVRIGAEVVSSVATGTLGTAPDPLSGESTARYAGTIDYAPAWTRAPSSTFASRNLVSPPDPSSEVVLNEVLYNPLVPGEAFVEVYYLGGSSQDLTGYRLVSDTSYTFLSTAVNTSNRFAHLLASARPAWFASLNASGDNVYLYDAAGRLLDMVGWSAPHTPGRTLARVADGVGGREAYDDPTAVANGWEFDRLASLGLITLEADTTARADPGTIVQFVLFATNQLPVADYINVAYSTTSGWPVSLLTAGGAPLTDSPGDPDTTPDLGWMTPGQRVPFVVEVRIPASGALGNRSVVTVIASAAVQPLAQDGAVLTIELNPHFDVRRTVDPTTVYVAGTGPPYNEVTTISLRVEGAGMPVLEEVPHDVVFQIDGSGSMNWMDPTNLRVDAVRNYIDGMRWNDRASIIGFTSTAWVVNNRPLTNTTFTGKNLLKGDANTLACSPGCTGGTNIDAALSLGNNWLITYGLPSRPRIEILLTDGDCSPVACTNTANLVNQAIAAGIVIYTVGLGAGVNQAYLQSIAIPTGGQYYFAATAQDLDPIFRAIGNRMNATAGVDLDVTDDTPMMEEVLMPYMTFVPGSFTDPATGLPRPPEYVDVRPGRTVLQWNVSTLRIGDVWSVEYRATSQLPGTLDVARFPDARVAYTRWDRTSVFQPFPQGTLEVLSIASPPYLTATQPWDGAVDVATDAVLSATFSEPMNPATLAWTIAPGVALSPSWTSADTVEWTHGGLEECTTYVLEVTSAEDAAGEALVSGPVPNPWSFSTVCPPLIPYTITRSPAVGSVLVDGSAYAVPATFLWRTGDVHDLSAPEYDPSGGSRLAFVDWDDGGARDHAVTVGDVPATITASYVVQHPAALTLVGLRDDRPANVASVLWSAPSSTAAHASFFSWVDDGSEVSVDALVPGETSERFVSMDEVRWTVAAPLARTVRYTRQFVAAVHLVGLEGHGVELRHTALGVRGTSTASSSWSEWVDAGSPLSVSDSVEVGPRERYRTLDPTRWTVDAPLEETVSYRHQFRPRVVLEGTEGEHAVGARWRYDGGDAAASSSVEWYRWADAATGLDFDNETAGTPPRYALDPTAFVVDSPFDATIRYVARAPPPPPEPSEENWKPVLALAYALALVIGAVAFGSRPLDRHWPPRLAAEGTARGIPFAERIRALSVAELEDKVRRDRRFTRLILLLPFAGLEAAIGLLSLVTGLFRIPEGGDWLPLGFWVNTAILASGLVAGLLVWRKGYRLAEDELLRLAEEAGAAGEEADGPREEPPSA